MASEHDITIYWANKPTYNRHKVAIEIQDAGNLLAIAREFVKVVDSAFAENGSTEATWSDPAVVMVVNKLDSLCHASDFKTFGDAYDFCRKMAPDAR